MEFDVFKSKIEDSVKVGLLDFSLLPLDSEIAKVREIFGQLDNLKIQVPDAPTIELNRITLKGTVTPFKNVSFLIIGEFVRNSNTTASIISIIPVTGWVEKISGTLGKIINTIKADKFSWCMVINNTDVAISHLVSVGEQRLQSTIQKGSNYYFNLESQLFHTLRLDEKIFEVQQLGNSLSFKTSFNLTISLGKLITVRFQRLEIPSIKSIILDADINIGIFGALLPYKGMITLGLDGVSFEIDINTSFVPKEILFLRKLKLSNTKASVQGNLTTGVFLIGLSGDFAIEGTPSVGLYNVKQNSLGNTPPELFQFEVSNLTFSAAATAMTGITIKIPDFFDRFIIVKKLYMYYAATEGLKTKNGEPARVGMAAEADVLVLGYAAYGELDAYKEEGIRGKISLAPLRFGNLIEISGSGAKTKNAPANAIELKVVTASNSFAADVKIVFVKTLTQSVKAVLGEAGLNLSFKYPLKGFATVEFDTLVSSSGTANLNGVFYHYLSRKFGPIELNLRIKCTLSATGKINVGNNGKFIFAAFVDLGHGLNAKVSTEVTIDDISETLEKFILEIIEQFNDHIFKSLEKMLEAALIAAKQLLEAGEQVPSKLFNEVGRLLQSQYGKTADQAMEVVQKAGYQAGQLLAVAESFYNELDEVLDALKRIGLSEEKILISIKDYYANYVRVAMAPYDIAVRLAPRYELERLVDIISDLSVKPPELAKVLYFSGYQPKDVVKALRHLRVDDKEVAQLVMMSFDTLGSTALAKALLENGVKDATGIVEGAFRTAGRELDTIRRTFTETFRRFKLPKFKFKW